MTDSKTARELAEQTCYLHHDSNPDSKWECSNCKRVYEAILTYSAQETAKKDAEIAQLRLEVGRKV
jgi:hypothetical protein